MESDSDKDNSDDENEYEVESILNHRRKRTGIEYLVKWKNWSEKDATWESERNLNCKTILESYNSTEQPQKNKSHTLEWLNESDDDSHASSIEPNIVDKSAKKSAENLVKSVEMDSSSRDSSAERKSPSPIDFETYSKLSTLNEPTQESVESATGSTNKSHRNSDTLNKMQQNDGDSSRCRLNGREVSRVVGIAKIGCATNRIIVGVEFKDGTQDRVELDEALNHLSRLLAEFLIERIDFE